MISLVTGATGFIGSHLVELLLSRGHTVRVLIRKTSSLEWLKGLPLEHIYGDLFDRVALEKAVAGVDYVFHSAGLTKAKKPEEYFRANQEGTRNIANATLACALGIRRFVHLSSQTATGPSPTSAPITEDFPPHPLTTYGWSKLKAEQEVLDLAGRMPVTICRLPAVYGPRDKDIFEFFNTYNRGLQPIVGFSEKFVSLLHVADVVRGIVLAAESEKSKGQVYFISSERAYGWKEVGEVTRAAIGKGAIRLRIPEPLVYVISAFAEAGAKFSSKPALINIEKARDMVQDYWTCDSSKAARDFGYRQQIPLDKGIRDTIDWYRKQGWLRA
jgi:nucleoside-diphosphate-sugar epimerase